MDQISAAWETAYQDEYNVLNYTNLDDVGQPYSCSAWGNQGSLDDNLMTEDPGYNTFNDFNQANGFPSNVFIDHNMVVFYKANNLSYALANIKFEDMLEACEDDAGANCFQCTDCDQDGTYDDVDNCPGTFNPSQEDDDGDGIGNECDDCNNLPGDINDDLNLDILDIVNVVNIILSGGINSPDYTDCALTDANIDGNSVINILDVIQLINMVIGDSRLTSNETGYAVAQMYYNDEDLVVRIESGSDISGVEMTINTNSDHDVMLIDNSHITTKTSYFDNQFKVLSYNIFNDPFDGHVIEYRIDNGKHLNQNDIIITIGGPEGNEFFVSTNFNGNSMYMGPTSYVLNDVYPNPFNPSTQVSFSLPMDDYVTLHAYDLKGVLVDSIFEGHQIEGNHTYTWDASSLASGVYYIKMISGSNVLSTKAMLLK